jgi:hypothetical protein
MELSIDREKVIRGLEKCKLHECDDCTEKGASQAPWDCPVYDDFVDSAIVLLKEQEAVEPEQVDVYGEDEWWGFVCVCPDCKTEWMTDKDATHFCPNCGRPVKWE